MDWVPKSSERPTPTPAEPRDTPTLSGELEVADSMDPQRDRLSLTVLTGHGAGRVVRLGAADVVVGRSPDADLQFPDTSISRRHARFFRVGERVFVEDLGSVNGTRVRGETLDAPVELQDGDYVQLGDDRIVMFNRLDAAEEDAAEQLYEASVRDTTSGAYNRRYFDYQLQAELALAQHHGSPLVVMLLDIDDFTSVNDCYGHVVGDAVLRVLATSIQRTLKPSDTLARFGGDEFAVLCRDTSTRNGHILAERIRAGVERLPFSASGNDFHVTVSVGVAGGRGNDDDSSILLETADRAMYQSKESRLARDQASFAPPDSSP